ncbi:MAG TPA: GvpL/GvpF family gas vesicle protein, partial [Dehalococcoidia bacterium]|nr:GvpL/GvpF family gas vesicle protein [Dehalococcoidia bacterium]
MDDKAGKYLYCIIKTAEPLELPPVNGEEPVHTIHAADLAAVVRDAGPGPFALTRSAAMAHLLVIQEMMKEFAVLPFS